MGEGYHIVPERVLGLATTLAEQQQPLRLAAEPLLRAARGLRTGDPGTDAQTRAVADQVEALHRLMGRLHASLTDAVTEIVGNYRAGDVEAAEGYLELLPDGEPPAGDTPPASDAPTS